MTALEQLDRIKSHDYVGPNAASLLRHDLEELENTLEEEAITRLNVQHTLDQIVDLAQKQL